MVPVVVSDETVRQRPAGLPQHLLVGIGVRHVDGDGAARSAGAFRHMDKDAEIVVEAGELADYRSPVVSAHDVVLRVVKHAPPRRVPAGSIFLPSAADLASR